MWRTQNMHNETEMINEFPISRVRVGKNTYGPLEMIWMAPEATVSIGNYCSIGPSVKFLVGGEHNYRRISTWPFQSKVYGQKTQGALHRDIVVEDDVWIGYDSLVMSGVTIGKGSVIGARSIVTRDVPPYSIYVGNRVIKQRFSQEVIDKIKAIDFAQIVHGREDAYSAFCQSEVTEENVEEILRTFVERGEE